MKKLFCYIGDSSIAYRKLMAEHKDFYINDILIPKSSVVIAEQTHSSNVKICSISDSGAGFDEHEQLMDCDGMVTDIPNQFLLIRTADCTPVLFYDELEGVIGAVHSGREGTRKNIVNEIVWAMHKQFYSLPENIKAWIGPGICVNHYQVSDLIWEEFRQSCLDNNLLLNNDKPYIDIQNIILQQLLKAGIKKDNITRNDICTYESNIHFSYRKDGTNNRQINVIGLIDG